MAGRSSSTEGYEVPKDISGLRNLSRNKRFPIMTPKTCTHDQAVMFQEAIMFRAWTIRHEDLEHSIDEHGVYGLRRKGLHREISNSCSRTQSYLAM